MNDSKKRNILKKNRIETMPDEMCWGMLTRYIPSTYSLSLIWADSETDIRRVALGMLDAKEADQIIIFKQVVTFQRRRFFEASPKKIEPSVVNEAALMRPRK